MALRPFYFPAFPGLTKTLGRIMRITGILLLAAALHVSANGLSQKVTLSMDNVPVQKVFSELIRQTGISIVYTESMFEHFSPVSIRVKDASIQDVLNKCLKDQPFAYSMEGSMIVIRKTVAAREPSIPDVPPPIDIHGRVTDSLGNPLVGASVTEKGTHRGTSTDAEGRFTLSGINSNASITVSYTGYKKVQWKLNGKEEVSIQLERLTETMEEVVVNKGYYTTTRQLNTGNVSVVGSKEIEKQPVNNPLGAIQGRMSGVYIEQSTGLAGGGYKVQIRGQNSLRNYPVDGNLPLYIIDGIPFTSTSISSRLTSDILVGNGNPLSSISPSDIESIEVLKDADATSIYGSRGANGVILITTKKGKAGKTNVDLNIYHGSGKVERLLSMLNTEQYLEMRKEAFRNDNATPQPYERDVTTWDSTRYTNWQKELMGGTASITDAQVRISGGSENTQFVFGGGIHNESTVYPGDFGYKLFSLITSINHRDQSGRFNASLNIIYNYQKNNLFAQDMTFRSLTLAPNSPQVYDAAGKLNWDDGYFDNPYSYFLRTIKNNNSNILGNVLLGYKILPGLSIKASLGFTQMFQDGINNTPIAAWNPAYGVTRASTLYSNNSLQTWIAEPQMEYETKLGPGNLSALLGMTFQQSIQEGNSIGAIFNSDVYLENLQAAILTQPMETNYSQYRYDALYGRLNYNIEDKYILNLTARRDGSTRFGPGNQFANFGSIGAAWIFSKDIFRESKYFSFGKLRTSYGSTGNDQIGDYMYMDTYTPADYTYQNTTVLYPTSLANSDYSWEINRKFEIATDLGFIKDRILFSTSYYLNRSSNQLIGYTLPPSTGFSTIIMNRSATVQNAGIEMDLRTTNVTGKQFSWTTNFNISFPRNKLVSYPNLAASSYARRYKIGEPLTVAYSYKNTGVDPATGLYQFEDLNKDGSITYDADEDFFRKISQQYYGGFLNSFRYKGFQLDIFFYFVKQTGVSYQNSFERPGSRGNQPSVVLRRWQHPGDVTDIQRYTQDYDAGYMAYYTNQSSTNYIVDASFIRLKNLSLSYSAPDQWLKSIHMQQLRLYLQGQNLVTFTNYIGMDPETQSVLTLPPLRVLTAGIQIGL